MLGQSERKNSVGLGFFAVACLLLIVTVLFGTSTRGQGADFLVEVDSDWVLLYPATLTLTGTVLVDGVEVVDSEVAWSMRSGPGVVDFTTTGLETVASFSRPGDYELQVEVRRGRTTVDRLVRVRALVPDASYYVATDGSDDNDGRTIDAPFLTIRKAASVVRPGDVVMIRGGIYYEYNNSASIWQQSGTEDSPITFMGYPGETAIIDGSTHRRQPSRQDPTSPELIRLRGLDWYIFDGLVLRNSNGSAFDIRGNHHVIRNVITHSNHGVGIFFEGDYNTIVDSMTFNNNSWANEGESADGVKITRGHGNVIRRVIAYDNSDDGFDLWATTGTLIEYSVAYRNGRGADGDGNGFKLSSAGVDSGNVVRFNVSYSNRAQNFTDNGGGALEIYNNTSYDAGSRGFVVRGRAGVSASVVYNNISYQDRSGVLIDIQTAGGSQPDSRHNSWDLDIRDPLFQSTDPHDEGFLRLRAGSPAEEAGIAIDIPSIGGATDLGALQRTRMN